MARGRDWDLVCIANNSANAAKILDQICTDLHHEWIQTDDRSEFGGKYEDRSHKLGIIQYILPLSYKTLVSWCKIHGARE